MFVLLKHRGRTAGTKSVIAVGIVAAVIAIIPRSVTWNTLKIAVNVALRGKRILVSCLRTRTRRTVILGMTVGGYLAYRLLDSQSNPRVQDFKSNILNIFRTMPVMKTEIIRTTFNDLPLALVKPMVDHTHGIAAADRSSASIFIDSLADSLGKSSYFIQRSRADERNGRMGSRAYHWVKDLNTQVVALSLPENPLPAMVDVDQYLDMPSFLCENIHPTIVYTFQPDQVSKVTENYSYTFNSDNEVVYNVTGGGRYQHTVWNYSTDNLIVSKYFCSIPYATAAYQVDRRSTSPDHELILFSPLASWSGIGSLLSRWWLKGTVLTRLKVVTETGFTRLTQCSSAGVKVSTGRPGSFVSATIPANVDDTIAAIARTSKYDLTMPQVLSFVDGDRIGGAALLEYHRAEQPATKPDVVCPVPQAVRRYQFDPGRFDPEAKASMVAFMTPMVHGAFCPDQTVGNEIQCVKGRVEQVRPKELVITPFLRRVMKEFVACLIPENKMHKLDPVDEEEVVDRQSRASQRRILAEAESILPDRKVSMFMKKEPYANIKDPRAISMINGVDKREYSRFMYAFETVLKSQEWYAFGHTPKVIADRVTKVLEHANQANNTDFNRFDGHGSNVMRELERMALLRAFRVVHHEKLAELHRSQFGMRAVASFGTWYETWFTRASGSPETALFNSLTNGFVAFLSLRMTRSGGVFLDAKESYVKLGIYGGDDGLTADVRPEIYRKAAQSIGQEITVEPVLRGQPGIKFLARVYSPYVWFGDVNSCCDLPRQLAKLHVTVSLPPDVTPQMKLLEKVRSFILSDENTPIIGLFCKAVMTLHKEPIAINIKTLQMRSWLSHYDKEVQFPNAPGEWMNGYANSSLPTFDEKKFTSWIAAADSYDKLLSPPMFMEPPLATSRVPVVVDNQVIPHGTMIVMNPLRPEQIRRNQIDQGDRTRPTSSKEAFEKKETFEQTRERKIKAGTWKKEKPDPRDVSNGQTIIPAQTSERKVNVDNIVIGHSGSPVPSIPVVANERKVSALRDRFPPRTVSPTEALGLQQEQLHNAPRNAVRPSSAYSAERWRKK